MKFMLSLLAIGYVALANPVPSLPVHPGGIGGLFKGPNSETIIKGPDGSVITAAAEGGEVLSNLNPIVVVEPVAVEEVAPAPLVTTADTKLSALPAASVIATAPAAGVGEASASAVSTKQSSDLIGPSGRISTEGSQAVIAGPSSTTVAGEAVLTGAIARSQQILEVPVTNIDSAIATPISVVSPGPVATITGSTLAPLSVTPIAAIKSAEIAPISVTAAPIAALPSILGTISPVLSSSRVDLAPNIVTAGAPSVAPVTAIPPVATVTPSPQAVASVSASPHLSVASASSTRGGSATAFASQSGASASATITPSPPSVTPPIAATAIDGTQRISAQDLLRVNDRIDVTSQLISDQIAIDNRQLALDPAAIPPANIIPPEIIITPKNIPGRLRPTPSLTTPGLGAVASSTNIQRGETDATANATPSTLQLQPQDVLTEQQLLLLQSQQNLLNSQIQQTEQAAGPGAVTSTKENRAPLAADINSRLVATSRELTLADINQQQQLLGADLIKSGIDPSQLQLTNIPLNSVSTLPTGLANGVALKGLNANSYGTLEEWGRYGRNAGSAKRQA